MRQSVTYQTLYILHFKVSHIKYYMVPKCVWNICISLLYYCWFQRFTDSLNLLILLLLCISHNHIKSV